MANLSLFLSVAEPSGFWITIIKAFENVTNNYVLAVIFLTVVIKLLWTPIDMFNRRNQQKMSAVQAKMQPELDIINKKYAKDPVTLKQKQNEVYKKYNSKSMGSCFIMLLVMALNLTIFFTLFSGLNTMGAYKISESYDSIKYTYANCLNVTKHYIDNNSTEIFKNYENIKYEIDLETNEIVLYNGENQKPTATVLGAIQLPSGSYETIDITVSVKAPYQTNHSQAGNYTAVASTNNTNYQLLNTTLDYQIKQTSININENDKNIITIDCPEGLDANISISYNDITNEIDVENIDVSHILENGTIDKVIKLAFNQRSEIQSESLGTNLIVKINLNEISSFSNIKIARLNNNHLEYISSTIEDNCLVFNTTQLGDFAIITTEPNVWWPWLLLVIGGIVIILIVSCTLIYLRKSATFILDEKPIYIATGFKGKKIKVPENLKKYQWYKDKNLKVISTLVMQNENIDLFAKTIEPKEEIKINSDAEYLKEVEQPKVKKAKTQTTSKTVKKESTSSKNTKAKNTSKIAQTKTKKEDIGNTEIKATPKNDNKNKSTAKSKTDTSKLKNGTTNKSNSTVKKTSTTKEKTSTSKTQKKTVDGKITRTKSK